MSHFSQGRSWMLTTYKITSWPLAVLSVSRESIFSFTARAKLILQKKITHAQLLISLQWVYSHLFVFTSHKHLYD